MSKQPLVSVIIPTYNREKYIKRAIDSALNQSYKNIEIIVVDDGSTDNTRKVLAPYIETKKIRYFYQDNAGPSGARNNGIRDSQGEYIAVLDSDDFWCDKQKLEKQIKFLEKNQDYISVGGGVIALDEKGRECHKVLYPETDEEIRKFILFDGPFVHSSLVFRKDIYKLVGGYDESPNACEDWDLFLKFGKVGKLYNFQDYFIYYSQGKRTKNYFREHFKFSISMRKRYRNDYPGYSKAILLGWLYYFYSFAPFSIKRLLSPIISRIRKIIFGPPGDRYKKTSVSEK